MSSEILTGQLAAVHVWGGKKTPKQYLALCHIPILPGTGRAEEEEGGRFLLLLLPYTKLRISALLWT